MITIKDIARESGYSVGTVSRTLNGRSGVSERAKKEIMAVVQKYNFQLNENAKYLKQQKPRGIALILKGMQNMLFASMTELLQKRIEENHYECAVFYLNEDDNEVAFAHQIVRERKPEGILFLGCNLDLFQAGFRGIDVPCVLVTNNGAELEFENISSVSTDDEGAAEFVINHLISRGHRRIGVIGGDLDCSTAAKYRYQGCMNAFRANGIEFDHATQYESGFFTLEAGYQAMGRLQRKMPDMTAVFAMADIVAIGAIRAASDRGYSVPKDLSVIGFDGVDIGDYLTPRLTTIRQNREAIAARSIGILLSRIRGEQGAIHELEPFQLIAGNSIRSI